MDVEKVMHLLNMDAKDYLIHCLRLKLTEYYNNLTLSEINREELEDNIKYNIDKGHSTECAAELQEKITMLAELLNNKDNIEELDLAISKCQELQERLEEQSRKIKSKDSEIEKLIYDLNAKNEQIKCLIEEINNRDNIISALRDEYSEVNHKLKVAHKDLEDKIEELEQERDNSKKLLVKIELLEFNREK